jgi:hypothetical protein
MITLEHYEQIRRMYHLYVDKSFTHRCIPQQFVEAPGSYNAALDLIHTALRAESEGERYTGMLRCTTLTFALRV